MSYIFLIYSLIQFCGNDYTVVLHTYARALPFWGPLLSGLQEVIGFGDLWGPSGTSGDHLGPLGTIWGPLGTIWEIDSMKLSVSLRIRTFRSARIDPSSLPKHRRTNFKKSCRRKNSNIQTESKKKQKRVKRA